MADWQPIDSAPKAAGELLNENIIAATVYGPTHWQTTSGATHTMTLQQLHDAEIPGSISWLFDSAWEVTIGSPVRDRAVVASEEEAMEWLKQKAREIYGWEPK